MPLEIDWCLYVPFRREDVSDFQKLLMLATEKVRIKIFIVIFAPYGRRQALSVATLGIAQEPFAFPHTLLLQRCLMLVLMSLKCAKFDMSRVQLSA